MSCSPATKMSRSPLCKEAQWEVSGMHITQNHKKHRVRRMQSSDKLSHACCITSKKVRVGGTQGQGTWDRHDTISCCNGRGHAYLPSLPCTPTLNSQSDASLNKDRDPISALVFVGIRCQSAEAASGREQGRSGSGLCPCSLCHPSSHAPDHEPTYPPPHPHVPLLPPPPRHSHGPLPLPRLWLKSPACHPDWGGGSTPDRWGTVALAPAVTKPSVGNRRVNVKHGEIGGRFFI